MTILQRVAAVTANLLICAVATAAPGSARPPEPLPATPVDEANCTFSLTAPRLNTLPTGGKQVSATLAPSKCFGRAQPVLSTVCVAPEGSQGHCAKSYAWQTAEVFATNDHYDGRFIATGSGCWLSGDPATKDCTSVGPIRVTF